MDNVTFSIRRLSPAEFAMGVGAFVDIYIDAMGYSPDVRELTIRRWKSEVTRPGFTAVAALDEWGAHGFAYGFIGTPDTWWDRQLRRGLIERGGPTAAQAEVLRSYFELAEIHVAPRAQGSGLGSALLGAIAWNLPASHILLSTPEVPGEANAAFGLYRKFGFEDFLRELTYPADSRSFAILRASLPLVPSPGA